MWLLSYSSNSAAINWCHTYLLPSCSSTWTPSLPSCGLFELPHSMAVLGQFYVLYVDFLSHERAFQVVQFVLIAFLMSILQIILCLFFHIPLQNPDSRASKTDSSSEWGMARSHCKRASYFLNNKNKYKNQNTPTFKKIFLQLLCPPHTHTLFLQLLKTSFEKYWVIILSSFPILSFKL